MTENAKTEKLDIQKLVESLVKEGVINPDARLVDVVRVASDVRAGTDVSYTAVYDSDKYFAIMK